MKSAFEELAEQMADDARRREKSKSTRTIRAIFNTSN